jgi:hypothetical protein
MKAKEKETRGLSTTVEHQGLFRGVVKNLEVLSGKEIRLLIKRTNINIGLGV